MGDQDRDLEMRVRMAEADAADLREALIRAVFRGNTRPSNETLLAFAIERIEHSQRIAPDNPDGLPLPAGTCLAAPAETERVMSCGCPFGTTRAEHDARIAAPAETEAGDALSCPQHGPGPHVQGQAFGRGEEWWCSLCGDTFLAATPPAPEGEADPLRGVRLCGDCRINVDHALGRCRCSRSMGMAADQGPHADWCPAHPDNRPAPAGPHAEGAGETS